MTKKLTKNFDKALLGTIIALAWPTMLEQILQTAVQYIDTAMVGSLGTEATAAVGATGTVGWMIISVVFALSIGFLSQIARAHGAGDRSLAKIATAQSTFIIVAFGVVATILICAISRFVPTWMQVDPAIRETAATYFFILYLPMLPRAATIVYGTVLRAVGDMKTPMRVGLLVNIINVVLNFLFIYETRVMTVFGLSFTMPGMGWGVIGAAIASAISVLVGGIVITVVVWKHPDISPRGQSFKPDMKILGPAFRIAVPNTLQRFATSFGFVMFSSMINSLGGISTATHTIANTVESAFYIPGYGMQAAAATLTGNNIGAGDNKKLKALIRMILMIEVGLMIISGAALFIFAPQMMSLFTKDAAVIALGAIVLRMVAVSEPFYGVSIIIEGALQGAGKTMVPFVSNVIGMWGIRIVGTFLLTQVLELGLVGAWTCMIGHNVLVFVMFTIYYLRGTWNPLNAPRGRKAALTAADN